MLSGTCKKYEETVTTYQHTNHWSSITPEQKATFITEKEITEKLGFKEGLKAKVSITGFIGKIFYISKSPDTVTWIKELPLLIRLIELPAPVYSESFHYSELELLPI